MLQTPVVLIMYNRPSFTEKVFSVIRAIQPKQLFVIADGAKDESDSDLCEQSRSIVKDIDWDAQVYRKYGNANSGCANTVIEGLDWVFEHVDRAIILEDDCIPHPSFFKYCEELLGKYADQENIMHISGSNLLQRIDIESSYAFSHHILPPWGWATWRRSWKKYSKSMDSWQLHKKNLHTYISQENFKIWTDTFEYLRQNKTTWDVTWNVDIWSNNGLGIVPSRNLVSNIGFHEQATFTRSEKSKYGSLPAEEMIFPLVHPSTEKTIFDAQFENEFVGLLKEINSVEKKD